jgi:transcriptional regulator with PAS, ATPase and Fis domain
MQRLDVLERMQQTPALRSLPLSELDGLIEKARICRFSAGELLLEEGAPGEDVYLLLHGRAEVLMRTGEGEAQRIAAREGPDWLGEGALLDEAVRSASVVASSAVEALQIPRQVFLDVLTGHPESALDLLRSEIRRLRESDSQLLDALHERIRTLSRQTRKLSRDNRRLRSALADRYGFESFIGGSAAASAVRRDARQASESDAPVLLIGETGTGKELVARAIHAAGERAERPFVALNCALMTAPLLESELFGHARGAFTGATGAKRGLVEEADGGTLFLDEVSDMPPALQGALLRFIELGEFRRLGETQVRHAHARIITATQASLDNVARAGRFRRDLLYRLDVLPIEIPPLRERRDDVRLLVAHCIDRVAERLGVSPLRMRPDTLELLACFDFPGNVRELENEVERLYASFEPGALVAPEHLSAKITSMATRPNARYTDAVRSFKIELVERALRDADGNRTRAAELLGVHRSNLVRMLRELDLTAQHEELGLGPDRRRSRRRSSVGKERSHREPPPVEVS